MGLPEQPRAAAETIRDVNRQRVLEACHELRAASRANLEQSTGLSRGTVASIVAELLEEGTLRHCNRADHSHQAQGKGRPPERFTLASRAALAISVDVGRRHVRVAVGDPRGTIVAERFTAAEQAPTARQGLQAAASLVTAVLADQKVAGRPVDVAVVGLPTLVTTDGRPVKRYADLDIARETGLAGLTQRVLVMNDSDLGALGEAAFGAARGLSDFIFFKLSTGVGVGLMIGGRLHRGSGGMAGDIGHFRLREEGEWCVCGNRGCLETLLSIERVSAAVRRTHPGFGAAEIRRFLVSADPEAQSLLYNAGWKAGRAIYGVINVLNPAAIVVGGTLGVAGEALLTGLKDSIDRHCQPTAAAGLAVLRAQHGERAEVLGGLAVALGLVGDGGLRATAVI
ncbi:MAG TPA: ROK family protein [Trebonia sp.]|nr:ROK family protein [Trebonia sp.]